MDDALIYFGDSVKALGGGKIGGYLVRFSTATDPDLTGDYFTKDTDFDLERSTKATVLYDHGLDPTLKRRKLGMVECKVDNVGVWAEGQLALRDDYEKAIYEMAEAGKLGWSSGSAPHLVERKQVGNAFAVTAWPLGLDASLTPRPAEPRTLAISLKSYQAEKMLPPDSAVVFKVGDRIAVKGKPHMAGQSSGEVRIVRSGETVYGIKFNDMAGVHKWYIGNEIEPEKQAEGQSAMAVKGLLAAELAKRKQSAYDIWYGLTTIIEKIAKAAHGTPDLGIAGTPLDVRALVSDAVNEFGPLFIESAVMQINEYAKGESGEEHFWLKSNRSFGALATDAPLSDHSDAVVSAVDESANQLTALKAGLDAYAARVKNRIEFRRADATKMGAVLSKTNKEKLKSTREMMKTLRAGLEDCEGQLDALMALAEKPEPVAANLEDAKRVSETRKAVAEFMKMQMRQWAA